MGEPKLFRGVGQKCICVLRHDEICGSAADFENASALLLDGSINGNPDSFDEKVLRENHREDALALADAHIGLAEVANAVTSGIGPSLNIDIVFEHEFLRGKP